MMRFSHMKKTKDLDLSEWGPYSKHYGGISRILGGAQAAIADFAFLIGHVRGKIIIPDVNVESGYHHWDALPDLQYFSYRYELQWKDREYADVDFFVVPEEDGCLCRLRFRNDTDYDKEYAISAMTTLRFRNAVSYKRQAGNTWIDGAEYALLDFKPPERLWVDGDDYEVLCHTVQLSMGKDGIRKGTAVQSHFLNGVALGNQSVPPEPSTTRDNETFLMNPGTVVTYDLGEVLGNRMLILRYGMYGISRLVLRVEAEGTGVSTLVNLEKSSLSPCLGFGDLSHCIVDLVAPACNRVHLRVLELDVFDPQKSFVLDGMLITAEPGVDAGLSLFSYADAQHRFTTLRFPGGTGVTLRSEQLQEGVFSLYSEDERPLPPEPYSDCTLTHIYHGELSGQRVLRKIHNDALFNWYDRNSIIQGDGSNHFVGYNLGPVVVPSRSERIVYLAIVKGCMAEARNIYLRRETLIRRGENLLREYTDGVAKTPFDVGQQRLRTQIFTNLTYPVRIGRQELRTYTPGKRWGGLFTWDSGMHAIGLAEYEPYAAAQIVNQYLPETPDSEIAAVIHGSPIPLHLYVLAELYRRTEDRNLLSFFYQRALTYYRYFAGLHPASRFDPFRSGLLNPYAEGYNAMGIDDYPVQHYEGRMGLYGKASPVSASCHALRAGEIMKLFAYELGKFEDIPAIEQHNRYIADALQRWSWDESSGYYSHVIDETKERISYDGSINYNMGLDGVAPLLTGICTEAQRNRLIAHVMGEGELWTRFGICSVAMNAPYARHDGYWNGKVWIPHQWFLWKALLGFGSHDHARRIAMTALETWERNVRETYNCWEQYDVRTGQGEGCHQFAGLSAPLAAFHNAYFAPGNVVAGFDTLIKNRRIDDGVLRFTAETPFGKEPVGVLVVPSDASFLKPLKSYRLNVDGAISILRPLDTWIALILPSGPKPVEVELRCEGRF